MRRHQAFTLPEVVISLGLFASFMVTVCGLYASTWEALRGGEGPAKAKQVCYGNFFRLCRSLRSTPALLEPDLPTWNGAAQSGLVVREAGQVVGFRRNLTQLEELHYRPDYSPETPSSWRLVDGSLIPAVGLPGSANGYVKTLLEGVEDFRLDQSPLQPSLLHLQLQVSVGSERLNLDTCVNLREAL